MKTTSLSRRRLLSTSLATGAALGLGRRAWAQDGFPSQRMEAIIPFAPGGGTDRSVRVVTPAWAEVLGTGEFRLNHSPGAGSLIAQNLLQNRPHDGHSVLFSPAPHVAWLDELQSEQFSADQVAWLGSYFQDPNVLLVAKDSPYQTIEEFLDAAANASEPFTASVSSPMSAAHAATVVLREKAGVRLKVVPFEGGSQARNAVAGGHVDCCMAPYWSAINVLELTRALAIFAPEDPTEGLWDAPPAAEVLPFEMPHLYEPYGAMTSARAKTEHPDRFERLRSTFAEAMTTATFRDAAAEQNLAPFANLWSAEQCTQFMAEYLAMLADYKPSMEQDLAEM